MQSGKQDRLKQLSKIDDHIHHIRYMISDGQYYVDILYHLHDTRKGIEMLDATIFENHLHTCVPTGMRAGDTERVITELVQMYHLVGNR